jgi:hypothetical protein
MKRVAVVAAVVVVAAGIAAATIRATAAPGSASLPVAYGFDGASGWHRGEVKPQAIYFGVGGSLFVRDLSWVSWSQDGAVGRGIRWADSCAPTCAAGKYSRIPAQLSLSRVRVRGGVRYFSQLTMQWTINGRQYKSVFAWTGGAVRGTSPAWR